MLEFLKRLWRDESGMAQYVALAISLVLLLSAAVAGTALTETTAAQATLHNAAEVIDRSIVANGCVTQNALTAAEDTLQTANINPNSVYFSLTGGSSDGAYGGSTARSGYGQQGAGVTLGYDFNVDLPLTSTRIWHSYVQTAVASDQSQYVPQAVGPNSSSTSCVDSSTVSGTFTGVQGGQGSGGATSGVSSPTNVPTSISETVTPTTVTAGESVTVTGQVMDGTSTAPAGTPVSVATTQAATTAQTNGSGDYTATLVLTETGTIPVNVTADSATNSVDVQVVPSDPASISVQAPSSVAVGQEFSISGTVLNSSGEPVADGTSVAITSNDPTDIPNSSTTTTNGNFVFSVPNGITSTATNPVTVTVTSGSVSQSASIAVNPGAPQSVTLAVSPTSGTAGTSFTLSGQVLGPDGTPVAAGTQVTTLSPNDSQDSFPTLSTNSSGDYSGTVALGEAGQITIYAKAGNIESTGQTVTVSSSSPASVTGLSATPDPVNQGANDIISGTVLDGYGNPVAAGTSLTLASAGFAAPVQTTVGSSGQFAATVVFDASGLQEVSVQYQGATLQNGTVSVQVSMQGAYTLTATQSSTAMVAGQTQSVMFTLTDSNGNPVSGDTIDFSEQQQGNSTLSATSAVTDSQGQVSVNFTPTQSGNAVVTASLAADNGTTTGSAAWIVGPAAPYAVNPPSISPSVVCSTQYNCTQDATISGVVTDQYGNPIPGAAVSVTGGWDTGATFTGTTNGSGSFAISLTPVDQGGPYYPTVTVQSPQGTLTHTYTNTSLTVGKPVYMLTVSPLDGTSTPAGTPFGVEATLTAALGPVVSPVDNAQITFSVPTSDSVSVWSAGTPTPGGPSSVTVTTDSQGQATAQVAFEPYTGTQTVQAEYSYSGGSVTGTTEVSVTANSPSAGYWNSPTPNPVTAGQTLQLLVQLVDSYGFGLNSGQTATFSFDGQSASCTTYDSVGSWGNAFGTCGWTPVVPTKAGTYQPTASIDGQTYTGPSVTVNPAGEYYFYPVLGPANNTNGVWLSGGSWSNWTMAYGTLADPPTGGSTYSVAGIGYDQYGNQVSSGTASMSCSASNGGSCPGGLPTSVSGSWQNIGQFISGSYTLTFVPTGSSPNGVASSTQTTYITFTIPGLRGWNVQVGNGATVIGSGGPGSTINLGTLTYPVSLNFSIEGIDENGNVVTGYTNNGTDQEGIVNCTASNGGSCPSIPSVPLGSGGTPNGYTGWSQLASFDPGTYTVYVNAGQYGDAGGQNWTPTWVNTAITFTVNPGPLYYVVPWFGFGASQSSESQPICGWGNWTQSCWVSVGESQQPLVQPGGLYGEDQALGYSQSGWGPYPWADSNVSCSASNNGICPSISNPQTENWQQIGQWIPGNYDLTYTPISSPYGVASPPQNTQASLTVPGVVPWEVKFNCNGTWYGPYSPFSTTSQPYCQFTTTSGYVSFQVEPLTEIQSIVEGFLPGAGMPSGFSAPASTYTPYCEAQINGSSSSCYYGPSGGSQAGESGLLYATLPTTGSWPGQWYGTSAQSLDNPYSVWAVYYFTFYAPTDVQWVTQGAAYDGPVSCDSQCWQGTSPSAPQPITFDVEIPPA